MTSVHVLYRVATSVLVLAVVIASLCIGESRGESAIENI